MPVRSQKALRMCDLYKAIRKQVLAIRAAEIGNFKARLHHLRGRTDAKAIEKRDEVYDLRADRLVELLELLSSALPAGIDAGFSGEVVVAKLEALMSSVEEFCYWDGSFEGAVDIDMAAWWHYFETFSRGG